MMKRILLIITALGLALSASAQGDLLGRLNYGVKAGTNISDISNMDGSARFRYYAGVSAEYMFDYIFSIQPEVILSLQGNKHNYSNVNEDFVYKTNLTYLNIPVLAKANVIDGLSIEAGPQLGFCLGARGKTKTTAGSTTNKTKADIENIKTVDAAFCLGATYIIVNNFGVQARYNIGLTDIVKNNSGNKCRNDVFQMGVVYQF